MNTVTFIIFCSIFYYLGYRSRTLYEEDQKKETRSLWTPPRPEQRPWDKRPRDQWSKDVPASAHSKWI
jgi:hypothetical protein